MFRETVAISKMLQLYIMLWLSWEFVLNNHILLRHFSLLGSRQMNKHIIQKLLMLCTQMQAVSDVHVCLFHFRYPPEDIPDVVVSELELWEVDSNIGGFFSLSYWRSVFNNRPDYNILLKQRDLDIEGEVEASATFVLHESAALDSSQQAFNQVRSTLGPLVDDGSLMMTKELLEGIITPKPREASRLVFELVEIMDKNVCISYNMPKRDVVDL